MDWNAFLADAMRDLVLLLIGALVAWLSGTAASRRTEKVEKEKQKAVDAAALNQRITSEARARKQATASEARAGLNVVYELDKSLTDLKPFEADMPAELLERLRAVADLIPDLNVRVAVNDTCDLSNSFELLVTWAPTTSPNITASTDKQFYREILGKLRAVLAAAARGDDFPRKEAQSLRELATTMDAALDAYWENQATVHEMIQREQGKSSMSPTSDGDNETAASDSAGSTR